MQSKDSAHLACAAQLELAQPAPLLDPTKHLLDAAAGIDRLGVALVAGGAAIDGRTTRSSGVLCHVWCDTDAVPLSDKALGVVVLVSAKGFLVGTRDVSRHRFGGIPLPSACDLRHLAIQDEGMAVVHQHVPPVAGQCRVGVGLTGQQGHSFGEDCVFGIRAGVVGLVAELDAAEAAFRPLLLRIRLPETLARA